MADDDNYDRQCCLFDYLTIYINEYHWQKAVKLRFCHLIGQSIFKVNHEYPKP